MEQYKHDLEGLSQRDKSEQDGLRHKLVNKEISADLFNELTAKHSTEYYERMNKINQSTKGELSNTLNGEEEEHSIINEHYIDTESCETDDGDGGDDD